MTSRKLLTFFHCPIHATYQYYSHVLDTSPLLHDVICGWSLGVDVVVVAVPVAMAVSALPTAQFDDAVLVDDRVVLVFDPSAVSMVKNLPRVA